jgi:hypothetical protein
MPPLSVDEISHRCANGGRAVGRSTALNEGVELDDESVWESDCDLL